MPNTLAHLCVISYVEKFQVRMFLRSQRFKISNPCPELQHVVTKRQTTHCHPEDIVGRVAVNGEQYLYSPSS